MIAIEATLENGQIILHKPLPKNISQARVFILVDDRPAATAHSQEKHQTSPVFTDSDLEALALTSWAEESANDTTDWEVHFGLKPQK